MKGRKILKVISNALTSLLFIVLICAVFVVISSRASGADGPEFFGYQFKTVLSGSMEPKIQTGSIIATKLIDEQYQFDKGDVVTYKTEDGILITHRIVKIKGGGKQYITKGDNNDGPDIKPVLSQNIVGVYTGFTLPYVGYVVHFADSQQGVALLMILPGLLLLGYACFLIWRSLKEIDTRKVKETTESSE